MTDQANLAALTEDEWVEKYQPTVNTIVPGQGFGYGNGNEAAGEDNSCLYGTTEPEMAKIREAGDKHIWTVMDGDEGETVIGSGMHHVNRIGYIITEKPWDVDIEIVLED